MSADPWQWARQQRDRAPRTSRRKTRWPIKTTPPRCDHCGKQRAPGIDHTACKDET